MTKAWVCRYYVANKFGSMQERQRTYGVSLPEREVRERIQKFLVQKKDAGLPVYPSYDLAQELVA